MKMNQVLIEQCDLFYKNLEQFFKAWFSWIHLLSYSWIVYSWQRSTVCKYRTSNAVRIQWETFEKNGYGQELDELIQCENWDTKWTTISGAKAECGHQWRRGWLRDTAHQRLRGTSQSEHPQVLPLRARMTRTRSLLLSCTFHPCSHLSQVWVLHFHTHPHVIHVFDLLALTFSLYFLLFLPSLFLFFFLFLTNQKFVANLYNSAKEGVDTTEILSFPTPWRDGAIALHPAKVSPSTTRVHPSVWMAHPGSTLPFSRVVVPTLGRYGYLAFGFGKRKFPCRTAGMSCEACFMARVNVVRGDSRHESDSTIHAITKVPRILDASKVLMMSKDKSVNGAHHHDPHTGDVTFLSLIQ